MTLAFAASWWRLWVPACAVGALLLTSPGCGGTSHTLDGGQTDGGQPDAAPSDLGTPGAQTTYLARHDGRRCAAPACGGFFLQAMNQADTLCADGTRAAECYVADLDWAPSALGAGDQTRATSGSGGFLLDGRMEQRAYGDGVVFGELKVDAAWVSEWGTPHTVPASVAAHGFARTGRLCIVDPCFDILMSTLNTDTSLSISGVDLSAVGASGPEQALGVAALDDGTLRATGTVMTDAVAGPGGFGETYHATQFYLRLPIDAAP